MPGLRSPGHDASIFLCTGLSRQAHTTWNTLSGFQDKTGMMMHGGGIRRHGHPVFSGTRIEFPAIPEI
ncbi:hypothetical protein [Nitrosomonas sp. ANs5]|uniref:hypothetical protein n=1 Tax=Nitrosomonas sp. ANs5 TaxID=3423941 RepID=UPI003D3385B3